MQIPFLLATAPNSGSTMAEVITYLESNYFTEAETQAIVNALNADIADKVDASALAAKADQTSLDALTVTVGLKADATALAAKADQSSLDTLTATVATKADTTALADKVDKVTGKGLSTEDYTTAEKTKLGALTPDAPIATQAEAEAGTVTEVRRFTPERIKQAIAALATGGTLNADSVGLGNVTNDAQTKAAIVPNTVPSAGQLLVGNAGGTAYAPVSASGDVTVSSTGAMTVNVSNLQGTGSVTESVGFRGVPLNSNSAAYTLVLADAGKVIYHPSADTTARIWTIPANASVAFPVGTALTFVNDTSAGSITIAITTDVLVLAGAGTTGSRTLAANGMATAIKVSATRWIISGTNLT